MKICLLGQDMNVRSGHSRLAWDLAVALADRQHEVVIVARADHREAIQGRFQQNSDGISIITPFNGKLAEVRPDSHVGEELRSALAGVDLIQEFEYVPPGVLRAIAGHEIPTLITADKGFRLSWQEIVHNGWSGLLNLHRPDYARAALAPDFLLRRVFEAFDAVICTSKFLAHQLTRLGLTSDRAFQVPIWVDLSKFPPVGPTQFESNVDFLYYGWGSSIRGVGDLITAFGRLQRERPQASLKLHLTGQHGLEEKLTVSKIQTLVSPRLTLDGYSDDIWGHVTSADCIVLPFRTSFGYIQPPLTVVESMALGKTVISTSVGSVPEIVENGKTGIVVSSRDPAGLQAAMRKVYDRPELALSIGSRARFYIAAQHDARRVSRLLERIYAEIVSGRR